MKLVAVLAIVMALFARLVETVSAAIIEPPSVIGGGGSSTPAPVPDPVALFGLRSLPAGTNVSLRDLLAIYARENIEVVHASVYAETMVHDPNTRTYISFTVPTNELPDLEAISASIRAEELTFRVADTNDWISFSVTYSSSEGYALFYGGSGFRLERTATGWVVPKSALSLELYLASHIPLTLSNLFSVELMIRDQYGNVVDRRYIGASGSAVWLPTDILGLDGNLKFTFLKKEGDASRLVEVFYDLRDGRFLKPIKGNVDPAEITLSDFLVLPVGTNVVYYEARGWELFPKVVELKLTAETKVSVYAQTPEEVASGFTVKAARGALLPYVPITAGGYSEIILGPGTYFFSFDFPTFGKFREDKPVPYPGKG